MSKKFDYGIIDRINDEASLEYFNKPYCALMIGERSLLDNYIKDLYNPEWKPLVISGQETNYEVSKTGSLRNIKSGELRSFHIDHRGYPLCRIQMPDGTVFALLQHRAVAITFVPNPENKPEVNHIDGDTTHCYYMNLEWVTSSENKRHAYDTGLRPIGEENPLSRYKEKDVRNICELLEKGLSVIDVSKQLNVDHHLVGNVFNRACWKHISDEYNIPYPKKKEYMDEADIHEICRRLSLGESYSVIAKALEGHPKVNRQCVRQIAIGSKYANISDHYDIPGLEKSCNREPTTLTEKLNRMYNDGLDTNTSTSDIINLLNLETTASSKAMILLIRRKYKAKHSIT